MGKHNEVFPKCVDKKRDCYWFCDDGTCLLLSQRNKKCTFYKTIIQVALADEKRETLCRQRGIEK